MKLSSNPNKKSVLNKYSNLLVDLLKGTPCWDLSADDVKENFMQEARQRWFQKAADSFARLASTSYIGFRMNSKSNTITIPIEEKSPSGNSQVLEIKVALKVRE